MNKIITTILSLLLLLSICPTGSAAEAEVQPDENLALVKVTAPSVSSLPDREITIPVSIEGNPGFTNLAIALEYDPAKLELKSISTENQILGTVKNRTNVQWKKDDKMTCGFLVAASPTAVTGDGKLFTATFKVPKDFAETTVVTPKILYLRSNAVDYKVFQSITPDVASGTVKAILAGDVNLDGVVEYDDVMAAYQELQSPEKTFTDDQKKVADLNNNGYIDEGDVSAIYNIYTGGNQT